MYGVERMTITNQLKLYPVQMPLLSGKHAKCGKEKENLVRRSSKYCLGSRFYSAHYMGTWNWELGTIERHQKFGDSCWCHIWTENHCACTLFDACFSSVVMSIIYSLIARGTTVLVDYTESTGNFHQITGSILQKIPLDDDTKCTYVSGR